MATSPTGSVGGFSTDQFLQLLVAQLQNQDPLDPVNSQDFINQLTSLNTVSNLTSLNASFSQMLQLQQLTQGTNLIGKTVNYTPTNGNPTSGTVSSVAVNNGQFVLTVGSDNVSLDQIQSVS